MDSWSADAVKNRIVGDMRLDGVNQLYIWGPNNGAIPTYDANESVGLNFYGNLGYLPFTTTGIEGWSGAGFCRPTDQGYFKHTIDMNEIEDWYLHLAYKPVSDDEVHCIILNWGPNAQGGEYKFSIGFASQDGAALVHVRRCPRKDHQFGCYILL